MVSAIGRTQSSLEIDVEDTAHLVLGFEKGVTGAHLVATVNMDFVRHDTTRSCTVIGENGSLRWNAIAGSVECYEAGAQGWQLLYAQEPLRDESYLKQWQHFLACIGGSEVPLVSGEDGLAVLRVVEAAKYSSRERRVAKVGRRAEPAARSTGAS